mgnify:CR=1 FL=1
MTKSTLETNWTPERIREAARTHVDYGWAPCPGGHSGRAWNEDDLRIYNEEYLRAREQRRKDFSERNRP